MIIIIYPYISWWTSGFFLFFGYYENDTVNIYLQVFVWTCSNLLCIYTPRSRGPDHMGILQLIY